MPVSNQYLVQYLLQETLRPQHGIVWREGTAESGYAASAGSLEVTLNAIPARGGSRVALQFRGAEDEFQVFEPLSEGWLSRHYSDPDEAELARALRELMVAVDAQCSERRRHAMRDPAAVRDRVFRQLLADVSG